MNRRSAIKNAAMAAFGISVLGWQNRLSQEPAIWSMDRRKLIPLSQVRVGDKFLLGSPGCDPQEAYRCFQRPKKMDDGSWSIASALYFKDGLNSWDRVGQRYYDPPGPIVWHAKTGWDIYTAKLLSGRYDQYHNWVDS